LSHLPIVHLSAAKNLLLSIVIPHFAVEILSVRSSFTLSKHISNYFIILDCR